MHEYPEVVCVGIPNTSDPTPRTADSPEPANAAKTPVKVETAPGLPPPARIETTETHRAHLIEAKLDAMGVYEPSGTVIAKDIIDLGDTVEAMEVLNATWSKPVNMASKAASNRP
ncbi:hypothetical protein PENFLA_c015G04340 [Penicillium flavigenum]|uniref:Uncharacterized protein n=1 Tax=Penicillium flavigenum TaxID=254877 RepID=A0A1V6T3E2_9EURO|nr:hypothetical protein PENFLA_c015G04340 [Penicillium flavigenum]